MNTCYMMIKEKLSRVRWIVLLALVLAIPFAPVLINPNGRVLGDPLCDGSTEYYHFGHFAGQCWREGIVPLWNPHIMLGIPFLGEGEGSVFHPLSFLFALLPPGLAMNWLVATTFVLTGLFFYGYLRALGLGRPASWCGAAVWSFSSAMISRIYAGHLNILLTFLSAPMILMFWEQYRKGGGLRHLAGVALGYGLMVLAFYPQFLYIFSLFFLLYIFIQSGSAIRQRTSTFRQEGRAILIFGAFIVLGVGIGAIQLLPSLDFVAQSFRREATIEYCGTFSLAPENLLTLIAPKFFGSTLGFTPSRYWGRNTFWEMWIYIGVLPLLMAVAGAMVAPRRRSIALLSCAGIFLVLALGKYTPLFPLIYSYLPFFDIFRGSSKCALVTLFCLVVLSAYGFEALFGDGDERQRRRARRAVVVAGSVMFLACVFLTAFLVSGAEKPGSRWDRLVEHIWASGDMCVIPLTKDHNELIRASSRGAGVALNRTMVFAAIAVVLTLLTPSGRSQKYAFLLPIALVFADLQGTFMPMVRVFDEASVDKPLIVDECERTPYPTRILVPFNQIPNIAIASGYSSAFGYVGNTLKRYNDFINYLQELDPKEPRTQSVFTKYTPQFSTLGFDAIAYDGVRAKPPAEQKPIGRLGDSVLLPYDEIQRPRAFLAAAPTYFSEHETALSYVLKDYTNVWDRPAIERPGAVLAGHPLDPAESVTFVSYEPGRTELNVRATRPRELVLCSMFERNWKATVNGAAAPVVPANYVFRAVRVPEGTSRVVFEYKPTAFYVGAAITAASLLILLSFPIIRAISMVVRRPSRSMDARRMPIRAAPATAGKCLAKGPLWTDGKLFDLRAGRTAPRQQCG